MTEEITVERTVGVQRVRYGDVETIVSDAREQGEFYRLEAWWYEFPDADMQSRSGYALTLSEEPATKRIVRTMLVPVHTIDGPVVTEHLGCYELERTYTRETMETNWYGKAQKYRFLARSPVRIEWVEG